MAVLRAIAVLLIPLIATPAVAQPMMVQCARTIDMIAMLHHKNHEQPLMWYKPAEAGVVLQLWGQPGDLDVARTWTIVVHRNSGASCILASGKDLPAWVADLEKGAT